MKRWLSFLALLGACGGRQDASPDAGMVDAGTTDAPADAAPAQPGQPPPRPQTGLSPATNQTYTFAMYEFFLGDSPRDGSPPTPTAWQAFGYDLDGKATTASSSDVCALFSGAPSANQTDGDDGIDNAWGSVMLPVLQGSAGRQDLSRVVTDGIQKGTSTVQFSVRGLSDDPQQSSSGLFAQMFLSGSYGGVPSFDTSTDWPVLSSSLVDGQMIASGARSAFQNAYINAGTFVSGKAKDVVEVDVLVQGVNLPLLLHDAFFTFVHADHADAVHGTIAGVLDRQQLSDEVTAIGGRISPSLCAGPTLEALLDQFRRASDILDDASNLPGQPCTGISVGLGFSAKLVANPTKVTQVAPPSPDPCAD